MLNNLFSKRKQSSNISLPKSKTVHGIKIEKVKVGRYLESMEEIQDVPKTIIEKCFPDEGLAGLISRAKTADTAFIADLATKLLLNAPEIIIDLAVKYIDVDKETLLDLTPNELFEVLSAWWEINDLTTFFKSVWAKVKPMIQTNKTVKTGFNDGSQLPNQ